MDELLKQLDRQSKAETAEAKKKRKMMDRVRKNEEESQEDTDLSASGACSTQQADSSAEHGVSPSDAHAHLQQDDQVTTDFVERDRSYFTRLRTTSTSTTGSILRMTIGTLVTTDLLLFTVGSALSRKLTSRWSKHVPRMLHRKCGMGPTNTSSITTTSTCEGARMCV